jgi:small subunit ribosomal protein S1
VNHPSEILSIGQTVPVKVLDIDRDRQRISLGLKQTQEDPWQRVVDSYQLGDELEGKVTKVVSFGAFVEILDGVEGLVHISELAQHHVENPREVVNQGDVIRVKILEIDSDRRRLSLSAKRVEDQELPLRSIGDVPPVEGDGGDEIGEVRDLGLSDDVFAGSDAPVDDSGADVATPDPVPDEQPVAEPVQDDAEAAPAEPQEQSEPVAEAVPDPVPDEGAAVEEAPAAAADEPSA